MNKLLQPAIRYHFRPTNDRKEHNTHKATDQTIDQWLCKERNV